MIDVCLYLPGVAAVATLCSVAAVNPHILLNLSKNKRGHQSQTWSGSRVHLKIPGKPGLNLNGTNEQRNESRADAALC